MQRRSIWKTRTMIKLVVMMMVMVRTMMMMMMMMMVIPWCNIHWPSED